MSLRYEDLNKKQLQRANETLRRTPEFKEYLAQTFHYLSGGKKYFCYFCESKRCTFDKDGNVDYIYTPEENNKRGVSSNFDSFVRFEDLDSDAKRRRAIRSFVLSRDFREALADKALGYGEGIKGVLDLVASCVDCVGFDKSGNYLFVEHYREDKA